MSDEWDALSWKQKKAIKLALNTGSRMSMSFLERVYTTDENRLKAIKKMRELGFIEKSDIGQKYELVEYTIPNDVVIEAKTGEVEI